ncbi:hypothetical protein HaLaN_07944 [Haematococcus lacustris]|uniref:Uncharacterized protein n=1 Tax=Haematococcus lacustris TaxID=44745 RepID=A0A699YQX9_HAELA|nr:hypothetical protein HaLaN_07944 [Haematococcus lacustris]
MPPPDPVARLQPAFLVGMVVAGLAAALKAGLERVRVK